MDARGEGRGRVAVIGLDCVPPRLVFELWKDQLPNLKRLRRESMWGPLRSCHPPITVPAWRSMMTGRDPGELGVYGFRNRLSYAYDDQGLAHSRSSSPPTVWDVASCAGRKVILAGVPQTYPPPDLNGVVVSCFLTPSAAAYTHPPFLQKEIDAVVPGYVLDVAEYRTTDKAALLDRIRDKTRKHFRLARHLLQTRPWDFFMMVEMGPDRLHHAFWNHGDPEHPDYDSSAPFAGAMLDYYRLLDAEVGGLLGAVGHDATVLVVSDHGAKRMDGAIAINDWLRAEGYLTLRAHVETPTTLRADMVDWSRTMAWADGGYCGRIYLNVYGREPQGIVSAERYEGLRRELIDKIEDLKSVDGTPLASHAFRPGDVYRETRGIAPDLLVYFGDLAWRAIATVGHATIYVDQNDTGPDGANHDWDGILILRPAGGHDVGRLAGCDILDVAPTILQYLGLPVERDLRGRMIDASRLVDSGALPQGATARQHDAADGW